MTQQDPAPRPNADVEPVEIAPGDVLDIKFFGVPELNDLQTVRFDGRITLQLVGTVGVWGMSPEALSTELERLYAPHLKKPQVTVILRNAANRKIFVAGEVFVPGAVPMLGPMTVLEAIMQAGGLNMRTAYVKNVLVIRHADGRRYGAALDLRTALKGKPADPFYLEPLDIVYVPKSKVARAAQWIDTHINQMVPMLGLEYAFPVGEGTLTIDTTRGRAFR